MNKVLNSQHTKKIEPSRLFIFACLMIFIILLISAAASASTYQDVENYLAANPAPSGCYNWTEEVTTNGQKAVKVWRRCNGSKYYESITRQLGSFIGTDTSYNWCWVNGQARHWDMYNLYRLTVYCDGSRKEEQIYGVGCCPGMTYEATHWCAGYVEYHNYDCRGLDTLLANFFPIVVCEDKDGDGHYAISPSCPQGDDPDDNDPTVYPGATELCGDGLDNNCDGQVDEGCVVCEDKDGDGHYAISPSCPQGDDSDDNDPTVYPGASEKCDDKDNDVDGQTDENCNSCNATNTNSSTSLSTGSYHHTQDIFSGITLTYDSRRTSEGAFGKGWTHSYDTKIKTDTDGSLELTEDGVAVNFRLSGSIYKAEPRSGIQAEIIKNADNTYTLTKNSGIVYQFDAQGRLLSSTDRNGNQTTLSYTNSLLTSVIDPVGRITSFTYNASNKISQITDPAGRSTNLSYNTAGLLSSVTNPDAGTWTYAYDSNNRMTSKTDPLGSTTSNTYDANGRMIRATNPEGRTKAIAYDQTNKTSTVTEWNGGIWTYKYDDYLNVQTEIKDPDGNIRAKTYDTNKNLVSETDPQGNTTTYTYDTNGNMTSVKDAANNTTSYAYNSFGQATSVTTPDNKTTSYAYDAKGNLISVTDSAGAVTQYQYDTKGNVLSITDAEGKTTTFTYNQYNNVASITDYTGATTTFTYDISGNTTSVTDPQGSTTRFEYNSQNQIIKVIDSSGNATSSAYDAMGNRTSQTDANGNITRYEYNYKGQITKVIDSLGGITTYEYGGTGCASCSGGTDKLTALTDAVGNRTIYEYDLLGRLIKETDHEGKVIAYAYDASGNLISKTDATGITITYTYDALNRLTSINFPDSTQNVSYTYDSTGKVLTMTDSSGVTNYIYDNSNRLTTDAKTIEGKNFNVSYNYTLAGALTSITYPSGRVVSYEYDPIGRIVRVIEEKDGKRSEIIKDIAYLPSGAISSITQGNNIVTTKTYDNRNQLSSLSIGNLKELSYTRDNVGNITSIIDNLDPSKTKTYQYDALYRLTQATMGGTVPDLPAGAVESGLSPYSIRYEYDGVGNRLKETHNADVTDYSYQANKLISSSGAKAFTFNYDNNGNIIAENNKQYIYNQNQRLIKVTDTVTDTAVLGEYLYNANGQRVKKTVNGKITYFIYDQSGNLIEEADESGQVNSDYVYLGSVPIARIDEWWENMPIPKAPEGATIVPGDKQLTVSWTASPEPVDGYKVYFGTESGNYSNSIDVGKTTSYTITGLTNSVSYYVAVKAYADIKETYFYHTDHLGTPILMTDKNGTVVWEGEFLPFGEPYAITGSVENNLRFQGQYSDKETGLHQNYFRDYDPETGTYRQRDLIGFAGGMNLYSYGNNPVNVIDPMGLSDSKDCTYYEKVCKDNPTAYYCFTVQFVCNNWPDKTVDDLLDKQGWSDCVRQCLQDFDKDFHCSDIQKQERCLPLGEALIQTGIEPCAVGAHAYCFTKCYLK